MGDPLAKDVLRFFHGQLFGIRGLDALVRDVNFYPTFKPGIGALIRQEPSGSSTTSSGTGRDVQRAHRRAIHLRERPAGELLRNAGVTGNAFVKVSLDPAKRSGLLTKASVLALTTPGSRDDKVVRGKSMPNDMLCGTVPDPPAGIPPVADPTPGVADPTALEESLNDDAYRPVRMLDPIGFGFENYDGVGLWRDLDNGLPIDARGNVPNTNAAGDFNARSSSSTSWVRAATRKTASLESG